MESSVILACIFGTIAMFLGGIYLGFIIAEIYFTDDEQPIRIKRTRKLLINSGRGNGKHFYMVVLLLKRFYGFRWWFFSKRKKYYLIRCGLDCLYPLEVKFDEHDN